MVRKAVRQNIAVVPYGPQSRRIDCGRRKTRRTAEKKIQNPVESRRRAFKWYTERLRPVPLLLTDDYVVNLHIHSELVSGGIIKKTTCCGELHVCGCGDGRLMVAIHSGHDEESSPTNSKCEFRRFYTSLCVHAFPL